MNKTAGIIIAIIVVLGLGTGAFLLTRSSKKPPTSDTSTASSSATNTNTKTQDSASQPAADNVITYSNDGFSPASLTVASDTTITIKNNSSHLLQFDSDPHPQHTDDPELNVGTISPGQSKTITVTQTGSHGYHNHLNESDTGTLVVR